MYDKRNRDNMKRIHFMCLEDMVPENHLLRAIEKAIDWNFIYTEVKGLYAEERWGKPGIDPVSLIKIVMIQYIYGIPSMRQTIREIEVNNAYRWFIGYDIDEVIPHFSTFGKNYTRRFAGTDIFERIFKRILQEAANCGFLDTSAIFIDGTHVKANANKKKHKKVDVEIPAKKYRTQLEQEIEDDRKAHEKKPLKKHDDNNDNPTPPATKNITQSTTDPESGLFHKGEHEKQFAYVSNTACDKHNFILDFVVGAGNIHDSVMFDNLYSRISKEYTETEAIAIDAGYKTPWIMKQIIDTGKIPCVPYKRPMTKQGFYKKYEYVYDEFYDCYLCPQNQVLKYSTTNRDGYREYKSNPAICKSCPTLSSCTLSKTYQKTITRHIWEDYVEQADHIRYVPKYKEIYRQRKETIERVFADAKEKHGMRYTRLRGLQKVKMQITLTFACMNLKKLAKWKLKNPILSVHFLNFWSFYKVIMQKGDPCFA
jgi:transposase